MSELASRDRADVRALVLPTAQERARIAEFRAMKNLEVIEGDLTDPACVATCVRGVDVILHVGAVVSPVADDQPVLAHRVNTGAAKNIVDAVAALDDPSRVSVVMVGSVAQTGGRNPPRHWGRVGDPICVSEFDEYGQSKVVAERTLIDSGLPRWAWLRQSGILHRGLLGVQDPIVTHVPLGGVLEWVTAEDSARLLANIVENDVPDEFWCDVYNVGGGEAWRWTNWQMLQQISRALGTKDPRRWYERRWFARKNFHGHWYTDSDRLEAMLPFRKDTVEDALARCVEHAPTSAKMARFVPDAVIKHFGMKPLASRPRGTLAWIRAREAEKIRAYYGSMDDLNSIGDWSSFDEPAPSRVQTRLSHGYDEDKPRARWALSDLRDAAHFRGGSVVSTHMREGDLGAKVTWACADGHRFDASPRLVLAAGHWCPTCLRAPREYARHCERNAFLAQVQPEFPA